MALNQDEKEKLDETHDASIQVKTVLLGANGDDGLCGEVKRLAERHYELAASHNKLKRNFYGLITFLAGSGVLGGSLWGALH